MMELNDNKLQEQGVTVGATRKILLEIEKLKERTQTLKFHFEVKKKIFLIFKFIQIIIFLFKTTDFSDADKVQAILVEICDMAWTPMKPYKINNDGFNDDGYNLALAFSTMLNRCKLCVFFFKEN